MENEKRKREIEREEMSVRGDCEEIDCEETLIAI